MRTLTYVLAVLFAACSSSSQPPLADASGLDAGSDLLTTSDTRRDSQTPLDLSHDLWTDVARDVGLGPFGVITGSCGELDDELTSVEPTYLRNVFDFQADGFDPEDSERLTLGAQEVLRDGNAGGSSLISETFAFEVLARCDMATLLKTEEEVVYDRVGKKTDLIVSFDALKIGVSVTRAVSFPRDQPYTSQQAEALITDKLSDILSSTANVSAEDAWNKQILHVMTDTRAGADTIESIIPSIDPTIRADSIVIVTVTEGTDDAIYEE